MEQIRKGNDIKVYWEIITGGDGSEIPYELEGKALELYVQNAYEKVRISDFVANGNVIEWTFYGKDQKTAGVYSLTLIENNGSEGMRTVDECNAFELVTHSCKTGGNAESRVSIETVRLRSIMTLSDVVPDKELNKNSTNVVENGAIAREFEEQNGEIAKKQDIIPDLAKIREGASKGATALQEHQDISGKADTSGRYPEMSVGFADDLVGRGESVPAEFSFRASGGKSIKDGTARIKRLKGNSVVWNQGYPSARDIVTAETSKPFVQGVSILSGHKYALLADINSSSYASLSVYAYVNGQTTYVFGITNNQNTGGNQILTSEVNCTSDGTTSESEGNMWIYYYFQGSGSVTNVQLIDLTLMFGAGKEPTTIEEYNARKPIVADEYAYNEGEVIHMTAEGIKSVGDNVWDEDWENGLVSESNGEVYDSENHFCSKNKIRIIPNTQYYFKKPKGIAVYLMFYDADNKYIGWLDPFATSGEGDVFTTLNATYMRFTCYANKYNHDITISLYHSGWKAEDAKYQPYWEDRLMFDKRIKEAFPHGMQKWDMVYNKNGKGYIVKGGGEVDMGSQSWEKAPEGWYQINFNMLKNDGRLISPYHAYSTNYLTAGDMSITSVSQYVVIRDSRYTDAAAFKAAMAGVPLWYELAEPEVIEYDEPFNLDYKVADFGTEEIIAEQPSAPISADIIYQFNAVDMIREHELEITELQRIIATMQAQLTSLTSNNGGQ